MYNLDATAGGYTIADTATINILLGQYDASNYAKLLGWFDQSHKLQGQATQVNYAGTDGLAGSIVEQAGYSYENLPLKLLGWNGGAASYGAGNAANTLSVTVTYFIVDL